MPHTIIWRSPCRLGMLATLVHTARVVLVGVVIAASFDDALNPSEGVAIWYICMLPDLPSLWLSREVEGLWSSTTPFVPMRDVVLLPGAFIAIFGGMQWFLFGALMDVARATVAARRRLMHRERRCLWTGAATLAAAVSLLVMVAAGSAATPGYKIVTYGGGMTLLVLLMIAYCSGVASRRRHAEHYLQEHEYRVCLCCEYLLTSGQRRGHCPECGRPYDLVSARQTWYGGTPTK